MADTDTFGELLSFYRRNSTYPGRGGTLSQEKLAELLSDKLDYPFHRNTVGAWEQGRSHIRLDAREELIGLLEVLHQCGGITSLEEAENLVRAGNYRALDKAEQTRVFWKTDSRKFQPEAKEGSPSPNQNPYSISREKTVAFSLVPPLASRSFIGREALIQKLKGRLLERQIIALQGMAGTGKTIIARQLTHELRSHFGDENIFWLSLQDHNGNPRPLLTALGRACQPDFEAHPKDEVLAPTVQRLLEKRAKDQELFVVIDKVRRDDWAPAAKVIMQVIPVQTPVLLLVRDRDIAIQLGASVETVPPLTDDEAIHMFAHFAQREIRPQDYDLAREMVQAIGHLPMALMLAGKKLLMEERPGYGLANLLQEIKRQPIRALEKPSALEEPRLEAMFALSYNDLTPDLKYLFRRLGIFASGPVRLTSISGITGLEESNLEIQLDSLVRRSMLEWDDRPENQTKRCLLHPLLRQYARSLLEQSAELEQAQEAHLTYYLNFAHSKARRSRTAHDQLEATLANLQAAIAYATQTGNEPALKAFGIYLCNQSLFLSMRGYSELALTLLPLTYQACRNQNDRYNEARTIGNLGRAYEYAGETAKAIEHYQQALRLSRDLADPIEKAIWLENLWLVHRYLGEARKAAVYAQQALEIHRSLGDYARYWAGEGRLSSDRGDYLLAVQRYQEALEAITTDRVQEAAKESSPVPHRQILEITCLNELGLVHRHLGQVQSSIAYFERALAVCQESGYLRAESDTYVDLGLAFYNLGQVQEAIHCYEQALILSRRTNNRSGEANALGNLGLAYRHFGEVKKSIGLLEQALQICQEFGDRRSEANALADLGTAYRYLGLDQKAIEYHVQALRIREEVNDLRGIGASHGNLGNSYLNLGALEQAIQHLETALENSRKIGERRSEANALDNLGRALFQKGEIEKAIPYYEQALEISREIGHRRSEANRLGRLGNAFRANGDTLRAIPLLEQALNLNQTIQNRRGEMYTLEYLGLAYLQSDNERAREYLEKAIEISRVIGNLREEGMLLGHLGKSYFFANDLQTASRLFEQAQTISREIGNKAGEGDMLLALGVAHRARYRYKEAIHSYEQALPIHREIGDRRSQAMLYNNLGNVHLELGQISKAQQAYQQALEIYKLLGLKPGWGNTLANLGMLCLEQHQTDEALSFLEQALEMAKEKGVRQVYIKALGQLGMGHSQKGNVQKAIEFAQESLALCQTLKNARLTGQHYGLLGNVYLNVGQLDAALESLTTALALLRRENHPGEEEVVLGLLGQVYQRLGETTQAISCYQEARKLSQNLQNLLRESVHLKNLAVLHREIAAALENEAQLKWETLGLS